MRKNIIAFIFIFTFSLNFNLLFASAIIPKPKTSLDSLKSKDSLTSAGQKQVTDTAKINVNPVQIDTNASPNTQTPPISIDTASKIIDSLLVNPVQEETLTNTKIFIYTVLSLLGLLLFFFVFVMILFKTFHKKRTTRQSLLLSWSLFFIVSVIWIFIIWGLVAGFSNSVAFVTLMIFLFIISLIMSIIALKSR